MSSELFKSYVVVRLNDVQVPYSDSIKTEMACVRLGAWRQATDDIQKHSINRLHVNVASIAYDEGFEYEGYRDFSFKALKASQIYGTFDPIALQFVVRIKVTYLVNVGAGNYDGMFHRTFPSTRLGEISYSELEHKVVALLSSTPFSSGSVTGRIKKPPQPHYYNFPRPFKPVTRWERFKASWFWQGLQIPTSRKN